MRLTIHQPEHLPWLGFFHKATLADTLVLLDNVQFEESYFQNRNRIREAAKTIWITVPVLTKHRRDQLIKDVPIDKTQVRWQKKYWNSVLWCYQKAPYFYDYNDPFEKLLVSTQWERLCDLNYHVIKLLFKFFRIPTKLVIASELGVPLTLKGPELILEIVKKLEATVYISGISGIAGRGKETEPLFHKEGIQVIYQNYYHPIYQQCHPNFIPFLSAIDLLFNHGENSLDILTNKVGSTLDHVLT